MADYLVESALLSQGIKSITEQELFREWPAKSGPIVWLWKGKCVAGSVEEFCQVRRQGVLRSRICYQMYDQARREGLTGALTASGTMRACEELGISLAVSAGIGGLDRTAGFDRCHDLEALAVSRIALLATAPKDMFSLSETLEAVRDAGITVLGYDAGCCDGYLFQTEGVKLSGRWGGQKVRGKCLYLQRIPTGKRLADRKLLEYACRYGEMERNKGGQYHPAVNAYLDEGSSGESSRLQLKSLIANLAWAEELT